MNHNAYEEIPHDVQVCLALLLKGADPADTPIKSINGRWRELLVCFSKSPISMRRSLLRDMLYGGGVLKFTFQEIDDFISYLVNLMALPIPAEVVQEDPALQVPEKPAAEPAKVERAQRLIRDLLAKGPVRVKLISMEAEKLDISERTLRQARVMVGARTVMEGGEYLWTLE